LKNSKPFSFKAEKSIKLFLTCFFIFFFKKAFPSETTSITVNIINPNNAKIEIFVRKPFNDEYHKINGQNGLFSFVIDNPDSGSDCKIVYSNHKIDIYVLKGEKVSVSFNNADLENTLKIESNIAGQNEYETLFNRKFNSPQWNTDNTALVQSADNWKSLNTALFNISKEEIDQLDIYKASLPKRLYEKHYSDIIYLNFDMAMNSAYINNHPAYLDSVIFQLKTLNSAHQMGIVNEQALTLSANYRFFLRDYFYQYSTIELNRLKAIQSFKNMSYSSRLYALTDLMFDDNIIRDWIKAKLLSDLLDFQPLPDVEPFFSRFMEEDSVVDYKEYLLRKHEDLTKDDRSDFMEKVTLKDMNGRPVNLSGYAGKRVYIEFWASWCGACIDEMINHLPAIKDQLDNNNVIVVSISIDEKENAWKNAVNRLKLKGVQLYAGNSLTELKAFFHLYSVPQYCLLDENGKLITRVAPRPSELADDERLLQTCLVK